MGSKFDLISGGIKCPIAGLLRIIEVDFDNFCKIWALLSPKN
jgi:hypothetical protein